MRLTLHKEEELFNVKGKVLYFIKGSKLTHFTAKYQTEDEMAEEKSNLEKEFITQKDYIITCKTGGYYLDVIVPDELGITLREEEK